MIAPVPTQVLIHRLLQRKRVSLSALERALAKRTCESRPSILKPTLSKWLKKWALPDDVAQVIIEIYADDIDINQELRQIYAHDGGNIFIDSDIIGQVIEVAYSDIKNVGLSLADIAKRMREIDYELFGINEPEDSLRSEEDWLGLISLNKDNWRIFVRSDGLRRSILAFWICYAPDDRSFNEAMKGNYLEGDICAQNQKKVGDGILNLYGPDFYISLEELRGFGVDRVSWTYKCIGSALRMSADYTVRKLASQCGILGVVCVPVFSKTGRELAIDYGLTALAQSISNKYALKIGYDEREEGLPALYAASLSKVVDMPPDSR